MCKLLTEPRVIKEISEPKKKTRVKKNPSEGVEVKYTIISFYNSPKVEELFKIYKADPYKARVKYLNGGSTYTSERSCIFEKGPKDFEICTFRNSFGISTTNRIYSSQKKIGSISYKNGKLWYIKVGPKSAKQITPLTYGHLLDYISVAEKIHCYRGNSKKLEDSKVWEFMVARFPWLKTLSEHILAYGINLNVVDTKGLTTPKDINRHVLGVPNNIAKIVMESGILENMARYSGVSSTKQWKLALKYMDGVQNVTQELLQSHYFMDSIKMAKTLGKKVNCRWNVKRLKEEHDKWAREIGNIVLDCEDEFELKIKEVYKKFAEYSKYNLLSTNKQMLIEGMMQDHCVGTYIDKVNRGECAIFHVDGYTLQVGMKPKKMEIIRTAPPPPDDDLDRPMMKVSQHVVTETYNELVNMQFRGKHNCDAPKELVESVNKMLSDYSVEFMKDKTKPDEIQENKKASRYDEWPDEIEDLDEELGPFENIQAARGYRNVRDIWDENLPF